MLRLGASVREMREMSEGDILALRLRLLIVMMKAYLDGCPMGHFRKKAAHSNARSLEKTDLVGQAGVRPPFHSQGLDRHAHAREVLLQRLELLIIMAKAFAGGYPVGQFRRDSIAANVAEITRQMGVGAEVDGISCLSVA